MPLKEVAAAVKSTGAEPLPFALDLSRKESAETLITGTLDHFGRIDALLNIAGAVPQIDLFEMTDEQWRAGLELKLHGARRLTILAWEALKASKGSVVLISGSAALDPKPGFAAVATINAAIIALAKAFAGHIAQVLHRSRAEQTHLGRPKLPESRCAVISFASAEEFLASDQLGSANYLVLHVRMPGMGGIELLRQLGAAYREIPVILSGDGRASSASGDSSRAGFFLRVLQAAGVLICVGRCRECGRSTAECRSRWRASARSRNDCSNVQYLVQLDFMTVNL